MRLADGSWLEMKNGNGIEYCDRFLNSGGRAPIKPDNKEVVDNRDAIEFVRLRHVHDNGCGRVECVYFEEKSIPCSSDRFRY